MTRNHTVGMARVFFRHDEWNVGIIDEPISVFLEPDARPKVNWLPRLERGKYIADPFGVTRDNEVYILCEEFDYRTGQGVISCVELSGKTSPSPPKVAIESPVHMSYPYLLEQRGEIYCVPETFRNREIGLYKAEEFPYSWEKAATLIEDVAGLDGTVFQYQGRWWLVCTDYERGGHQALLVWYAPELLGPWKPNSANPVKIDSSSARPAGTPFVYDGQLYRPAQDCSRTYGGRIVLNRVLRLTTTEFEEEQAAFIEPYKDSPYPDGIHTVSAVGDSTLIDARRTTFIKSAFKTAVRRAKTKVWTSVDGLLHRD